MRQRMLRSGQIPVVTQYPAVAHAVGTQGLHRRPAELQSVVTEAISDHTVEQILLPGQQVAACRAGEAMLTPYNFAA